MTASRADFVVSESRIMPGRSRPVMFDSLNKLSAKLPPRNCVFGNMAIAMEFSDCRTRDEIVEAFRKVTGEGAESTPEQQEQANAQSEAIEAANKALALPKSNAKVREINARAAQIEAENAAGGGAGGACSQSSGGPNGCANRTFTAPAQAELANRTMQFNETPMCVLRSRESRQIEKSGSRRFSGASNAKLDGLKAKMDSQPTQITGGEHGARATRSLAMRMWRPEPI